MLPEKIDWDDYFTCILRSGEQAAKKGKKRSDNPYLYPTVEWVKWNQGYSLHNIRKGNEY